VCLGSQSAPCEVATSYGKVAVSGTVEVGDGTNAPDLSLYGTLPSADATGDILSLDLWSGMGAMAGGVVPGTYTIAGADTDFTTCGLCVYLRGNVGSNLPGSLQMATGGTVTITSVSGTLQATVANATFKHVTVSASGQVDAPDGCATTLTQATFNGTVPALNDTCPAALALNTAKLGPGFTGTIAVLGDTTNAAADTAGTCRATSGKDLVYSLTIPAGLTRDVKATMQFATTTNRPYVYIRKSCSSTTATEQVACAYAASGSYTVTASAPALGAGTYYIWADGYAATTAGLFLLSVKVEDPAVCLVPASFGAVTPLDQYATGDTTNGEYGEFQLDPQGNAATVEIYPGSGVFTTAVAPGTYTLSGAELNYATCGLCVMVYDWFGKPHMATGGTVTLSSVAGNLKGSLSNVTFEQVTINASTFQSTPVSGGCHTGITSLSFDTALQ
jgi:hypothetical protein